MFTTDNEVREKISKRAPEHAGTVKDKWFGTFRQWAFAIVEVDVVLILCSLGLEESIRQDVATIKAWPFLPTQTKVVGYAFEVETGRVREVVGLPKL